MALIIRDSFAPYATVTDMGLSYWDVANTNASLSSAVTRFGEGQSFRSPSAGGGGAVLLQKAMTSNQQTIFAAFAFIYNAAFSGTSEVIGVQYLDGTTQQVTISLRSDGAVVVRRGSFAGTVVQTFTGVFSASAWTQFQIKTVIDGSTGSVSIRLNGNTSDDFAATGLNIKSSANSYANVVAVTQTAAGSNAYIQHLALFDSSGSAPWNNWVGDVRANLIRPSADTAQKQFSPSPATSTNFGEQTQVSTNTLAITAGQIRVARVITAPVGGTLGKATANFNAAMTGNAKVALYDSDGAAGVPGTLLATSNQVTNPVIGVNDFTFSSPPLLRSSHQYYLAILTDTNCTLKAATGTSATFIQTQAYASGFPAIMTPTGNTATDPVLFGTITVTNSGCVQEVIQDGSASYVFDSTVGHYDLYDFDDLTSTPASILGLSLRAFVSKSDAGARSGALTLKSGATSQDSATVVLSTTNSNLVMVQDTDPNTGSAWTPPGIAAMQAGPKTAA
ncbi:MAG TPA: hypothetical protein VM659_28920 [Dongiaceae bacterium]|nr:hypothetical protein [Dongiaceae bacterium]